MNTSKYVTGGRGDFLKPELIKEKNNPTGVVLPGCGEREYTNTIVENGVTRYEKTMKPWITVSIDKKSYVWTMNKTSNEIIGKEIGFEVESWVGTVLKFFTSTIGSKECITAVVIQKPEVMK